jgi:uncharacterized protein
MILALLSVLLLGVAEAIVVTVLGARGPLRDGITGILLDVGMLAVVGVLYRRRPFKMRQLGLRRSPPTPSVGWVLLSLLIVAVTNYLWLQKFLGKPITASLGITLHGSVLALSLDGLLLCLLAPVIEEIFFRGLLYRALRNRLAVLPAALIGGAIFAAVHGLSYPINTLPPRLVFGIIACLLYERTGSLLPGIALHILIDAGAFESAVSGHSAIVFLVFIALAITLLIRAAVARPSQLRAAEPTATGVR